MQQFTRADAVDCVDIPHTKLWLRRSQPNTRGRSPRGSFCTRLQWLWAWPWIARL